MESVGRDSVYRPVVAVAGQWRGRQPVIFARFRAMRLARRMRALYTYDNREIDGDTSEHILVGGAAGESKHRSSEGLSESLGRGAPSCFWNSDHTLNRDACGSRRRRYCSETAWLRARGETRSVFFCTKCS